MRQIVAALCAVGVGCVALSACSFEFGAKGNPTVSQEDLQADISDRLSKSGEKPQSVTCNGNLEGEVGKTARCDVVLSPTNSFQPVITVTKVEGTTVSFEVTPAVSKPQLEQFVSARDSDAGLQVESVSCQAGLDGKEGAVTSCDTKAPDGTFHRSVEVSKVDGLLMSFNVIPMYTKTEIAPALLDVLAQATGQRPTAVTCSDDLVGEPGKTAQCTVVDESGERGYTLTVTGVEGDKIDFSYESTS